MRTSIVLGAVVAATVAAPVPAHASTRLARSEVRTPSSQPRGTVVLLHGGSWSLTGRAGLRTTRAAARRFTGWGYRTVNADYGTGTSGLADVLRLVRREAARDGGRVCVYGESAGGLWALLAAERRPDDVACVLAIAAPTDLVRIPARSTLGSISSSVFGASAAAFSATTGAASLAAPTLAAYGVSDSVVPIPQGLALAFRAPAVVRLRILRPGTATWLHTTVDPADLGALVSAERTFLTAHL